MKVCVVTGSRADFGLLKFTLRALKNEKGFKVTLVALGNHFSNSENSTYNEIAEEEILVEEKIFFPTIGDNESGIATTISISITECTNAFLKLKPDLIILLGDRHEIFGAAQAALICRIPVGHIHGGEITSNMLDDTFRHCITKISSYHFVSTEDSKNRVIQMGENPNRVFRVGGLGVDVISKLQLIEKNELSKILDVHLSEKNLLITLHPVTLEDSTAKTQVNELLGALDKLENVTLIFTSSNTDQGGQVINEEIRKFVVGRSHAYFFESLGQLRYLSLLKVMDGLIGNSSSGILEAPFLAVPTVNIGARQSGRAKSRSIIDCAPTKDGISRAIAQIYDPNFRKEIKEVGNLYGTPGASDRIVEILRKLETPLSPIKTFFDLN
jgi:GDP/UDP-N,N'-diacetylbacillosamine 2-epimerase (hydrolysing)